LEELFQPYKIISNRILRDSNNVSRGVGFARLSDRESAEAIIEKYDNKVLSEIPGSLPLQVRFADSPSQKRLKGQTQRRRQWRAREYNLLTGHLSYADLTHEDTSILDSTSLLMPYPFNAWSYGLVDPKQVSTMATRADIHEAAQIPAAVSPLTERSENLPTNLPTSLPK